MSFTQQGSPFLFDDASGRVVGIKNSDGVETVLSARTVPRLSMAGPALTACLFAQDASGVYYCTDGTATGGFGGQVYLLTGDPFNSPTKTALTATVTSGLLDAAGVSIGGGTIRGVWPTSTGCVFIVGTGAGKHFLYRAYNNAGTWTVGANVGVWNDKKAVLLVGESGGTHTANIMALHQRSLCVATISGSEVLLFGEYNVASGRVNGAANDWVRIWRSTDGGTTWSALLTFNTGGSNITTHCHSVIQNPHDSAIWICMGDLAAKDGIIRWDGTSAAPAANSTFAAIDGTSGWKAFYGINRATSGDVLFGAWGAFWLPDTDLLSAGAQHTMFADYGNTWRSANGPTFPKVDQIPPLIACRTRAGYTVWCGFVASTAAPRDFDIWGSTNDQNFGLIHKIRQYNMSGSNPVIGTLANVFENTNGQIVISAVKPRGLIIHGGSTLTEGSTLICNVSTGFDDGTWSRLN